MKPVVNDSLKSYQMQYEALKKRWERRRVRSTFSNSTIRLNSVLLGSLRVLNRAVRKVNK
jgi:hypothetical protein